MLLIGQVLYDNDPRYQGRKVEIVREERQVILLALMRLDPFSYFWTCWNVSPRAFARSVWLISSMSRRIRTRLPTCLSYQWD
jgi:hypothetical protein